MMQSAITNGFKRNQNSILARLKYSGTIGAAAVMALLVVFLVCPKTFAQEFRGTVSGTITDITGSVIPGADINVRETSTGTINHTVSDASGQYVVPFLLPGVYTISAKAPGFESLQRTGITVESQSHPVVNLTLKIGSVDQSVTVTEEAPQLDNANASVGQVISTESVADLPLNGRTPTTLAQLSAGVITTAPPQQVHPFDNNAGNSWSIGGTPNQVSEVLLDGSPDLTLLGALAYAPTQDSVQEVSVRPFDTDASFGHTIGGVINQITKSGTNGLHGSAYEFGQISGIDSNPYFNARNDSPTPVFHFNQYGLTVGGPVRIPKVYNGQNKLFFFFAWEGLKDSNPVTTTTTVPTRSSLSGSPGTGGEVNGDFYQTLVAGCPNGFANNPGSGVAMCAPDSKHTTAYADPNQLYNPYTATLDSKNNVVRTPIINNQLTTAGGLNSVALALMKLYPATNAAGGSDGLNNYISNAPSTDSYTNEFGRMDYNLSSVDHVFFDFRHNNRAQVKENYFGNNSTGTTLIRENFGATLDNVYSLNPTTIFDVRANWTYFDEFHGTQAQAYSPTSIGMPNYMDKSSELLALPYFSMTATGGGCGNFANYQCMGNATSALDPTTSYQVFADMVKIIGRHTLKAGFDGRQYRMSIQNFGNSSGSFTFDTGVMNAGASGVSSGMGLDLAALLLGVSSSGQYDLNSRADYHQYYIGTFVQDDWRVSDKLTLNMGLRFDIDTPFRERLGRTVNGFNPTATVNYGSTVKFTPTTVSLGTTSYTVSNVNTAGGLTFPNQVNGAIYGTNNGFFSPRFGFSYSLNPKTVIRGGFGIFVQPETLATLSANGGYSSNALSNQEGYSQSTSFVESSNGVTPTGSISNPFPSGFTLPVGSSLGASTFLGSPAAINFLAPNQHDPYSERWDIGIQRALTGSTMLEMLYVGNNSLHLPVASQNINAVPKQYLSTTPYRNQTMATLYATKVTNPFYNTLGAGNTTSLNVNKTVGFNSLLVPFPQYGTTAVTEQNQTIGRSNFGSGIIHIEQRAKHGLTLTANYSFSKMIEADTFLNDQDTTLNRRISPFDHTHHFTVGGTYALPFGKNKMFNMGSSRLWDEIAGGFVVNGIYQFQTGAPVYLSADIPLQAGVNLRDIKIQPRNTSPVPASGQTGNPALDTSKFVTGSVTSCTGTCDGSSYYNGQFYNHYRTLPQTLSWVRQDGFNNLDASILKNFHFTEKTYFQMRFETFNTLNHAVFSAPNVSSATSSSFGYITATTKNSLPRQIQIGGRLVF